MKKLQKLKLHQNHQSNNLRLLWKIAVVAEAAVGPEWLFNEERESVMVEAVVTEEVKELKLHQNRQSKKNLRQLCKKH